MLNLTKISKDEKNKTCIHFINKRKYLAKLLFLSALLVGYFSYVCILLAKTKECVFARHNCLTSHFLQETYTLTRTLRLNVTKVPSTFKV